ncbi:MAG: helix-turn-helix domain-containing protein [archaeon]
MLEKLQKLGLTEKESQIYLTLVRKGLSSGNDIAKETSSQRSVSYNILQKLVEKGLVNYVIKDKKRVYSISDPKSILSDIREKEVIANDLIKEIEKQKAVLQSKNKVEVYEGLEGLKVIHEELKKNEELKVLNATGLIFEKLKFSANHIIKDISKGKVKLIAVPSLKKTPMIKTMKHIKYLPKEGENYATTFIYDGKVVIQVIKEKPFLVKIECKEIFEGYSKDFDILWDKL